MSGLRTTNTDVLNVSNNIGLGTNFDTGTAGQVLASGGENQPCSWVANGTGGGGAFLRASGTGITIVNATTGLSQDYTGAEDCLISQTDDTNYTAGEGINGVALATNIIQVDTDNTTIDKLGSNPVANSLQVKKVPNKLIFTQSGQTNIEFDGSSAQTINLDNFVDTAGDGISITGTEVSTDNDDITIQHNSSGKNEVIKVPHDLTITNGANTITYNGGSNQSITIPVGLASVQAGEGIAISGADSNIISVLTDATSTGTLTTGDATLVPPHQLQVVKVPNALTINLDGTQTIFDGSVSKVVNIDTGLASVIAGQGIALSGANNNIISVLTDATSTGTLTTIQNPSLVPPNQLQVVRVPNALGITHDGITTTFDGSATKIITINPDNVDAGDGINITGVGTTASPRVIETDNDEDTIIHDPTTKKNKVVKVPFSLVAGNNITMVRSGGGSSAFNGEHQVIISSIKDGANQENSFYTRLFPSPTMYQFPPSSIASNWYAGGYGFTAFHPDFYIDIPEAVASLPAYNFFKVVVSIYEEERIAGRRFNTTDNRNGLIDFVNASGQRISPVYFFQSGAGFNTQSGNNPSANQVIGGRGQIEFSCILPMPPSPRPSATRIQPRFSNEGIEAEASSHHLFQAGRNGSFAPTGDIFKKEWILETHPINPSNFRNIT